MTILPDWSPNEPKWVRETCQLILNCKPFKLNDIKLDEFMKKSEEFPIKFPVDTGRCKTLQKTVSNSILERNINSCYPILHENCLELYAKFILFKRKYGTSIEKELYKSMSLLDFVDRLLNKRAVTFYGKNDRYLLINGEKGATKWETIGTNSEKEPLLLKDCISYDEIKLSVFLSVSSYTYFVNLGGRKNEAVFNEYRTGIQDEGIIVGCIGTRLKKEQFMEYQELVIDEIQNISKNGYGYNPKLLNIHSLFAQFYEENALLTYEEVMKQKEIDKTRYTDIVGRNNSVFDNWLYYKRMCFTIDTLLMEANERAKLKGTTAFVHVVGLGLGVWRISEHQDTVYMEMFAKRLKFLGLNLSNISDLCFAWINVPDCGGYQHGEIFKIDNHPLNGIKIHICKREPHCRLQENDSNKLLVVSYAWDGNALPGNEYWMGNLSGSGDSAAACSTQIPELHNSHINDHVQAGNLRIITKNGIVTLKKYQQHVQSKKSM